MSSPSIQMVSTRGQDEPVDVATAMLTGLAPDGGLYVPDIWPKVEVSDAGTDFASIAAAVLGPYTRDLMTQEQLASVTSDVFARFDHEQVAPIRRLAPDLYLMELFWGPTLAFKDIAMQMLGSLFDLALEQTGKTATVIGATSGDTGSAAMEAFRDRERLDIVMLYPAGRTTEVQRRQMTTIDSGNVHAVEVDGTFDDCQDLVKAAFGKAGLREELSLSTANSINFGRLITQFAYYYWATQQIGSPVSFAVPSGNFGNVYSGYAAGSMGLAMNRLIVGSNQNNVLDGFFEHGEMVLGEVVPTITPSMDIQIPSNLERLMFELYDRQGAMVAEAIEELRSTGRLTIPSGVATSRFVSEWYDDTSTMAIMADVHEATGRVVDPHTAIGIGAARASGVEGPIVCLATAHPSKFPVAVEEATGVVPMLPDRLSDLHDRPERMTRIGNHLSEFVATLRDLSRFV